MMMAEVKDGLNTYTYESLYKKLTQQLCLCDYKDNTVKILCDLTGKSQHSDVILQKLSLLTDLFEANHCRWAFGTSKMVLEDAAFLDCLRSLLQAENSLIAFCAGKCLTAAIANHIQHVQPSFLKDLISSITPLIFNNRKGFSRSEVNQIVYTLDALKNVGEKESTDEKNDVCSCMEGLCHTYGDNSHLLSQYCSAVVIEDLPSVMEAFFQMAKSCSGKSSLQNTGELVITSSNELTKILMAFLELLQGMLKYDSSASQMAEHSQTLILQKISDFLWLDNLSPVITKKILIIINSCFDHVLDNQNQTTNDLHTVQNADLYNIVHKIVTQVRCGWLEKIIYRGVHLGFGGINITRSGDKRTGGFCNGDYPLMRGLVKLVMSAAIMVLQNESNKEAVENVFICLHTMSKYIITKIDQKEGSEMSTWLFELFADQDDSLILIMMRALQLYKLLRSNPVKPAVQDSSTGLLSNDDMDLLNPHVIFIEFLDTVTFDPNLLLDLLISNETCFLLYLVRYIRCVLSDWRYFSSSIPGRVASTNSCSEEVDSSDEVMHKGKTIDGKQANPTNSIMGSMNPSSDKIASSMEEVIKKLADERKDLNNYTNVQVLSMQGSLGKCEIKMQTVSTVQTTDDDIETTPACKKRKISSDSDGSPTKLPNIALESPQQCKSESSIDSATSSPVKVNTILDETMTVLIRLRYSVEKISDRGLFPYNVKPLLQLLEQLEDRYEQ
ncbi:protein Lines homolog 1-like [Amphiura filiformis]|uniref:protein Lines homolog 1-like n=1 Tax=Amphiura filiformis TaxID=82378 RepID=UPI003B218CCB